jgi:hypothetical protein
MNVMVRIIGWSGRKAVLYIALIAAILAYAVWTSGDVRSMWQQSQTLNVRQADQLQSLIQEVELWRRDLKAQLAQIEKSAQTATVAKLKSQIEETKDETDQLELKAPNAWSSVLSKATLDIDAIKEEQERQIRLAFLKKKLSGLESALGAAQNYESALEDSKLRGQSALENRKANREQANGNLVLRTRENDKAQQQCLEAKEHIRKFDLSWRSKALDRLPFRNRRDNLVKARDRKCDAAEDAKEALEKARKRADYWNAARADVAQKIKRAEAWVENDLPDIAAALRDRLDVERESAASTLSAKASWAWAHYNGSTILKRALAALILIIASPYLIRLFCWFVLAPLAMRRSAIRLRVPDGQGVAIAPAAPSATSVAVRLQPGEELLVRQDYLQTSSHAGAHGTQWFLDWRKPLTSIATGLTFLTRVRGESETTTISATRDGLAEVTVLVLPKGGSCVLQPRALAAVAQPLNRPLRITPHWRLGSLNAWLTLQLRYLVFHGPARLVLKGGRGVRVEPAEQGRVFGQDQLVGFSADLTYSVARTETFWPYFLGRQQLLKDRVMAGNGVLIVEEAPLTAHRGEVRRGLEGMIDAGMKVFGM